MRRETAGVAAPTVVRVTSHYARTTIVGVAGLLLAMLLTLAPGVNSVHAAGWASVDTDVLNLRTEPGTWAEVLDKMEYGAGVDILDGPTDDGWYYVAYNGSEGWTYGGYLAIDGVSGTGGGYEAEHWIDVNRSSGIISLMSGEDEVNSFYGSFGWDTSDDGFYATANGTYYVYSMNADLSWTNWGQAFIQNWVAFDPDRSNGFHSWSMDEWGNVIAGGDGPTGGCVALEPWAAAEVYNFAYEGMRVEVHW